MKTRFSPRNRALRPAVAWVGIAMLSLGVLLGSSSAMAAPPAFTMIGNQATASFVDGNGANQLSTSNMVQTQVQQVGSYALDSISSGTTTLVNTKAGGSGNIVYASHTLTNTGNGTDSFNIVVTNGPNGTAGLLPTAVYADADGNGLPDSTTPLCSAAAGGTCTVPAQAVAGNGGIFRFVVAYSIPASSTAASPYSSATITATPISASSGLYTSPNTTAASIDNVNVTTAAAFSANLSLAVPTVAGPGNVAYPAAPLSGKHSATGSSCVATMAGARSPAAGCVYTTYTLNFGNTGGAAGVFYANNILPSGLTYVAGSAVWSGAAGTAMGDGAGADPVGIDFDQSGQNLTMRVDNVNPNVAESISYMVLVNPTATVGSGLTTNSMTYDPVTSTHPTADAMPGSSSTNPSAYTVTSTYGVVLGSATGSASTSADSTAGTPLSTTADQNVVGTVTSGGVVKFTQKVFNTGDTADTFDLSVTSNSFPAGSNITYFKSDGQTPLLDTSGDSIVDTGVIAAGASLTFVVQVQIPATAPNSAGYSLVVRATSINDTTKIDASGDKVNAVTGILLDLTNTSTGNGTNGSTSNGDVGAGPSPLPTVTQSTPAGTGSIFSLFIKNAEPTQDNTFNVDVSQSSTFPGAVPTGWTVKFVTAGATCSGTALSMPVSVTHATTLQVDVCVTPPTTAPAATTSVYFRATSVSVASSGVIVSDSLQDALTVTAAATYQSTVTPNNTGQVNTGGTVVYAHNLANAGAQTCGNYTVSATQSGASNGWTYAIYNDNNNNGILDAGDTALSGPGVGPAVGGSTKFLVRVFAPGGATAGQTDTVTFTVTYTDATGVNCGTHSVTDISTVVLGQVRAVKTQVLNTACNDPGAAAFSAAQISGAKPGQCITYQVVATNEGSAAVSTLSISDAVPNYTTLATTQPAGPCVASTGVTGSPAYASTATTVSCGTATSVPPNATLTLKFTVQITP